jgi:hypothetical protein
VEQGEPRGASISSREKSSTYFNMSATSVDGDLVVSVPPASLFSKVPWLVRPSPGINYNFVIYMYLAGSVLALLLFLLEKQILEPLLLVAGDDDHDNHNIDTNDTSTRDSVDAENGDGGDAWKEFAKGMQGMHFIFDPFVPCLFWSLIVRYHWLKKTKADCQEKKDN